MIGARAIRFTLVAAVAALVMGACGSSSKHSAGLTIGTSNVAGVGNVLVNSKDGKTLYLLTSEQGGKLTCTDENGCTKVWPDTGLPKGVTAATAGSGVNASMLGTVKSADGELYPTYAGWPLYEYTGDPGPGHANGQGIVSFGGTWETLTPAGTPVTAAAAPTANTATSIGY
jgi:predicted lipoprotein with Yx(FWY)xxD motif